ncbi:MAG TPA: glycerol-3-phosphate 1-O-acyltransferase PlsY [Firmicutes bacterium]|nr:glycerol-3-phosphate 1-O-acyltransferase PlsY [Bacillota bacterium]
MAYLAIIVIGYLIGSISFALIAGRWQGIDLRRVGSGNLGATNMLRTLGLRAGLIVLALDVVKGLVAVWLGTVIGPIPLWGGILGGLAAIAGHSMPFYLGFRGGRGVAVGLGTIIYLIPFISLVALGVFALVVACTRYVSLGSLLGATTVLVMVWVLPNPLPIRLLVTIAWAVLVWRHRANIGRLLRGQELRIQLPKKVSR